MEILIRHTCSSCIISSTCAGTQDTPFYGHFCRQRPTPFKCFFHLPNLECWFQPFLDINLMYCNNEKCSGFCILARYSAL